MELCDRRLFPAIETNKAIYDDGLARLRLLSFFGSIFLITKQVALIRFNRP
jgi:hypothetical protein